MITITAASYSQHGSEPFPMAYLIECQIFYNFLPHSIPILYKFSCSAPKMTKTMATMILDTDCKALHVHSACLVVIKWSLGRGGEILGLKSP